MFAYGAIMRPETEFRAALELVSQGLNDCEISRRLDIPRGTIRDWRHAADKNPGHRTTRATGKRSHSIAVASTNVGGPCDGTCRARQFAMQDRSAYFYLLGQYLGDGYIATGKRGVFKLRISCSWDYPDILVETADAMAIVCGGLRPSIVDRGGRSDTAMSWKHWPCVFPQHGPGRKHERPIFLADWQQPRSREDHVELVRGLMHSDGCRFINPVRRTSKAGTKCYEYVRYVFTNASEDIRAILCVSLEALEIEWSQMNARNISVARKASVERMEVIVGPKS